MYARMYACMHACVWMCMHVCVCADGRTDRRMGVCIDAWMHACMDGWMHVLYRYTYIYILIQSYIPHYTAQASTSMLRCDDLYIRTYTVFSPHESTGLFFPFASVLFSWFFSLFFRFDDSTIHFRSTEPVPLLNVLLRWPGALQLSALVQPLP